MKDIIKLLTAKQVSQYLQMPLRTVHHLSKQGKIKAFKIGGKWRYLKKDIDRYLSFGTDFSREPARVPEDFYECPDRRAYPRINTNFRCRYFVNLLPFKNIENEGIIKNMSAGGVLVINQGGKMERIGVNDPIDLDFNFLTTDEAVNIKAKGRIVRINKSEIGIHFRNITEEDKDRIIQYVG